MLMKVIIGSKKIGLLNYSSINYVFPEKYLQ